MSQQVGRLLVSGSGAYKIAVDPHMVNPATVKPGDVVMVGGRTNKYHVTVGGLIDKYADGSRHHEIVGEPEKIHPGQEVQPTKTKPTETKPARPRGRMYVDARRLYRRPTATLEGGKEGEIVTLSYTNDITEKTTIHRARLIQEIQPGVWEVEDHGPVNQPRGRGKPRMVKPGSKAAMEIVYSERQCRTPECRVIVGAAGGYCADCTRDGMA